MKGPGYGNGIGMGAVPVELSKSCQRPISLARLKPSVFGLPPSIVRVSFVWAGKPRVRERQMFRDRGQIGSAARTRRRGRRLAKTG